MSDKKIIIRNCPCFVEGIAIKGNEQKTQTCNNHKVRELTYCADITDCKLKQIVNKCKYYQKKIGRTPQHRAGFVDATNDILQLLDIQEVE